MKTMRKRLSFFLLTAMVMCGVLQMHAQTPYLPQKGALETTLASGQFASFAPKGDYTLEAVIGAGKTIEARNEQGIGFTYTALLSGTYRFAVKETTVLVFKDSDYLETISTQTFTDRVPVYTDIFTGTTDDKAAGTGIYDAKNMLKNPGFEEVTYWTGYDPTVNPAATDVRGVPTDWEVTAAEKIATSCRNNNMAVNSGYADMASLIEGEWAFMLHNKSTPLWQKLEGLKPSTWYHVSFRQFAHKDTSPATDYLSFIGFDPNGALSGANVVSSYKYLAAEQGFGNFVDVSYNFMTPDAITEDLYFVVKRTGAGCINHFDRMTMVEATSAPAMNGLTISGVESVKYESGTAYGPEKTLAEGEYYDMTHLVQNPTMDALDGWVSTTNAQNRGTATNKEGDFTGKYWENWNPSAFTGKMYQTISGLPAGQYEFTAAAFGSGAADGGIYLYANTEKVRVMSDVPTFGTVEFIVLDGTAEIGLVAETNSSNWLGLDNVTLHYFGAGNGALGILKVRTAEANSLLDKKEVGEIALGAGAISKLESAIQGAEDAEATGDDETMLAASGVLVKAITYANMMADLYANLNTSIDAAAVKVEEYKSIPLPGVADFEAALDLSITLFIDGVADSTEVAQSIVSLKNAEMTCQFTGPTPIDATFLVQNPTMDSKTGWLSTTGAQNFQVTTSDSKQGDFTDKFLENWNPSVFSGKLYQKIPYLPNGKYLFKAAAFGSQAANGGLYLFGNDKQTQVMSDVPTFYEIEFFVRNNTAEIGLVVEEKTQTWIGLDNVTLTFLGFDINDVVADLEVIIAEAEEYTSIPVGATASDMLSTSIAEGKSAVATPTLPALASATESLLAAIEYSKIAKAIYEKLAARLELSNENMATYKAASYPGVTTFETALAAAQSIYDLAVMDSVAVNKAISVLKIADMTCLYSSSVTPIDVTFAVLNPTLDDKEGWLSTTGCQNNQIQTTVKGGDFSEPYWENWHPSKKLVGKMYQLVDLPNGLYSLKAAAFGDGAAAGGVYLYANNAETQVTSDVPAYYEIAEFSVTNQIAEIGLVGKDNTTSIWMGIDNVTLTYLGIDPNSTNDLDEDSNLPNVYVEGSVIKVDGDVEYSIVTLSGVHVNPNTQLVPGTYIVQIGAASVKVEVIK